MYRCRNQENFPLHHNQQHGQALLLLVLILSAISASLFSVITYRDPQRLIDAKTEKALAHAKQALVDYASTIPNSPITNRVGVLPCPDITNDGHSDTPCNSLASQIGRLPWATIRSPDLRDGSGERLWYAVSHKFKKDDPVYPLNSNAVGQLTVTGVAPASNIIAIVFAPGPVVAGQNRSLSNQNNITHYLEGENANGDTIFTTAAANSSFNDRLFAITPALYFPHIEMRVAREARLFLNQYFTDWGFYPVAYAYGGIGTCAASPQGRIAKHPEYCLNGQKPLGTAVPNWFVADAWDQVLFYAVAPACANASAPGCTGSGGLLTVNGNSGVRALVISPGSSYLGQSRPCERVSDCLEPSNSTSFPIYSNPTSSTASNDRIVVVSP
jgi:hypothetical protein